MINLTENRIRIVVVGIGIGLVAIGFYFLYFIINEFLKVYIDIESSQFAYKIIDLLVDKNLLLTDQGNSVTIGEGSAVICALVFLIILAWAVTSVSLLLIKSGCDLLSPNVKSEIKHIKNKIEGFLAKNFEMEN